MEARCAGKESKDVIRCFRKIVYLHVMEAKIITKKIARVEKNVKESVNKSKVVPILNFMEVCAYQHKPKPLVLNTKGGWNKAKRILIQSIINN